MNMLATGGTRTRVMTRHALIAEDGHVPSVVPGISGAVVNVIISPAMGASLTQWLISFETGGEADFAGEDVETFAYVMEGGCVAESGGNSEPLAVGGYVYSPAGEELRLERPAAGTRLTVFQKFYEELEGVPAPDPIFGNTRDVEGLPFLGDPDARLKTLLPESLDFDMAVNLFTFQPGARLPFVETHVMEHGLMLLEGEGIYRLENEWYPVTAGDAIWMAPFCPQWFVAMGKSPAVYLYYKDVNRHPMV